MTQEAREGVERVKVLPVQCPLAFWFSQVMLAVRSRGPRRLRFYCQEESKDFSSNLPMVAQDLLAAPVTSVPSERCKIIKQVNL